MKFKMPPEWAPHQRIFMEWPVQDTVWRENLAKACIAFAEVAKAIRQFEPVTMIVNPGDEQLSADLCGPQIDILVQEHDDCWMRDNGCTFVKDPENSILHGVHWDFNAWGGKYPHFELDRRIPSFICNYYNIPEYKAPIILEGGSIHTNGVDTLLTTAQCLLNQNRNPQLSKDQISSVLCNTLGVSRVVYIPEGLDGDETDGHVDNIACFLDENTVLIPYTDNRNDSNYEILSRARKAVEAAGLSVRSIVQPPLTLEEGLPLTLSYVNFVFVNGGIVMPGFGEELEEYDKLAKSQLQSIFPDRQIVQVMTRDIIRGGGNIHCITQQMPAV